MSATTPCIRMHGTIDALIAEAKAQGRAEALAELAAAEDAVLDLWCVMTLWVRGDSIPVCETTRRTVAAVLNKPEGGGGRAE